MKVSLDPDDWVSDYAPHLPDKAPEQRPLTHAEQTVINRWFAALTEKVGGLSKALQSGAPPTVEAYREMVGELRGVNFAIKMLRTAEREASGAEQAPNKEQPLYVA